MSAWSVVVINFIKVKSNMVFRNVNLLRSRVCFTAFGHLTEIGICGIQRQRELGGINDLLEVSAFAVNVVITESCCRDRAMA